MTIRPAADALAVICTKLGRFSLWYGRSTDDLRNVGPRNVTRLVTERGIDPRFPVFHYPSCGNDTFEWSAQADGVACGAPI
jgi:hypothetical protein